ncbi:MAG: hypothetical protein N3D84_01455 [Candidatus Woesearchaeota archaeon]|nr:hypothetical protein [Candidatus Woesearchaeota archaeon]
MVGESVSIKANAKAEDEGKGVAITFDTLFEILRREKNRDELQQLNGSFFEDVIKYLEGKHNIIKNQQSGLFATDEREKTLIQIQNIKKIIRELYDRREKKIINMAINKARTESSLVDTSALMKEERQLFESLFYVLNSFRKNILENVIEAKQPCVAPVSLKEKEDSISVDKTGDKDRMGLVGLTEAEEIKEDIGKTNAFIEKGQDLNTSSEEFQKKEGMYGISSINEANKTENIEAGNIEDQAKCSEKRIRVRFLSCVPSFIGPSLEVYGPYEENENADVPEEIAKLLVEKGRAELVDDE